MLRVACLLAFFHARRHFVGFAIAPTNFAISVADDDHGGKTETTATFDNGGTSFDFYRAFNQRTLSIGCHGYSHSNVSCMTILYSK